MSGIDVLLRGAERYAAQFKTPGLSAEPARKVAVVTCMDARFLPGHVLDVGPGDVHIMRNAGGLVTEDMLRSLAISQRKLGTRSVMVVMHTKCGMRTFSDDEWRADLAREAGQEPPWAPVHTTEDVEADVRTSVRMVRESPFIPYTDDVRGFVFDVDTAKLHEIAVD